MGIYGAINSAVSGLAAQATALENISGNVANSQTTGYKRLDTTFSDLVSGGGSVQADQVSGTTYSTSRATNTVQGDISANDVDTYMAINGEGYFVVTSAGDVVDGQTTFADTNYYTRAGDFEIDEDGYMVNSSGYYLMGYELDPDTGNAVGDATGVIQIDDQPIAAEATSEIEYQANLPTVPQTEDYDGSDPTTALLNTATVGTDDVADANDQAFLDSSISGGSVTIYNDNGTALNVEVRWGKTANAPPAANNTWSMFLSSGGNDPAWLEVGNVNFDTAGDMGTLTAGDGSLTSVPNGTSDGFEITGGLTIGDVTIDSVNISFSNGSLTQYSDPNGVATSVTLDQDGYAAGEIVGVSIDESGRIVASYSNSQTRSLYEIPLATFDAEQALERVNGAAFAATPTSGEPDLTRGGSIISNALELSNADIASEFSKLIVTQQAYSANSKIVTSADEMLDSALNMVR
ncbi:flagellar hook protein FlgE [Roseibium polysiphoniae]|uniref:Flagellar hook protein FlgE n=1 Tax=Roseibium polysiphoniae TaxID=2571221 RepID=A0ABR9C9Z0_9HYPH|nr:flagellar hook-basal body complex protein [Roseibium polysiphoniae]MBD8876433.1 flagellar hook-basal body complex protein [Roseibium polysiphoniae]